jgi:hypothetical protein
MSRKLAGFLVASAALVQFGTPAMAFDPAMPAERGIVVAAAKCPPPKITCREWCRRNPQRHDCMTGHPNSCDKKPQGADTCVY